MADVAPYPRRLRDHASVGRAAAPRSVCGETQLAAARGMMPAEALEVAHDEFERIVNHMMLAVDLLQDVHDDGEWADIPAIRAATTRMLRRAVLRHSVALERLAARERED
jgi:hypothetical protein